ncbi:fragile X mental retardation 1 neighbor protein isoform X1 [Sus scrofa]|uniref:fragile X mental retardation 1 neighbor protein isoform X1 n=1 Tax=Sus scrofa TaxID=9823 RepID=UPI00021074E1|nr:fragile X mental retardation 1 neighbor protein isoform X1 [Sus scrofa]
MPSEGRLMRGRIRSKTRGLRGPRSRVFHCEPGCNAAVGSHPGGSGTGRQAVMAAATPQPSWQASLRGLQAETRHSLLRMWAYKRFGLLLLGLWGLLLLYYYLSPGFVNSASPSENTLWTNENANGQSLEKNSASRALLSFFFPTTCILKENQVVKPCNPLQDFNKTECLRNKCCYSSLKTSNFNCFVPLKDKPTQMFRMFGFGVISMLILGWLPIYCFSLCQRSRWANPLRRKMNRILKGLKKQRNKLKRDAEMLGTAMDEEGLGDEKEQETKALFSH